MIVEALVNLKDYGTHDGHVPGDIITILPENSPWGKGDLKCRIIVQMDLDLPCKNGVLNCSGCSYMGLNWNGRISLSVGDTALPKIICPKERYTAANIVYNFVISEQGLPGLDYVLLSKRRAHIDLSNILSNESLSSYIYETNQTDDNIDKKLYLARKKANIVSVDQIIEK